MNTTARSMVLPTHVPGPAPASAIRGGAVVLAVAVSLLSTSLAANAAPTVTVPAHYTAAQLGTIDNPGGSAVVRHANTLGEVVGGFKNKAVPQQSAAFLLSSSGFDAITSSQVTDFSASYGINDTGEIAGVINGPSAVLPFRCIRHTNFQLLPLLGRDTSGGAYGINSKGEAVGFSAGAGGVRAVWWSRLGFPTGLPGLEGNQSTKAVGINAHGDIIGYAGEGNTTAVLWPQKGAVLPLDNLPGFTSSQADSLNEAGDVVGSVTAYDQNEVRIHAVLWSYGSVNPFDLGTLPGGTTSRARDIDANDFVVGTSGSSSGNHAFIWSRAGGMQDLNTLSSDTSMVLVDALNISSQGVILAVGINKSDFPAKDTDDIEEHELPRHIVLLAPAK